MYVQNTSHIDTMFPVIYLQRKKYTIKQLLYKINVLNYHLQAINKVIEII